MFENTHALPVIDTIRRRGIDLRREHASLSSLMWEIERTFSILEEILRCENIWYTRNRDYYTAIGLKTIVSNLMVISNMNSGENPRELIKNVVC